MSLFSLTEDNLSLVLDGLCYIFEQAAFQNVGPEPLYEQIQEAGVDDAHAKVASFVVYLIQNMNCNCKL